MEESINKDSLLDFFKEPTIETFSDFLNKNVGESNAYEFKEDWDINDTRLAKTILAIMNCGGGCIVFGVSQNKPELESNGMQERKIRDEADFIKNMQKYFPESVLPNISLKNFFYDSDVYGSLKDKKFQVIFITIEKSKLPVICQGDGDKINKGDIFIRRGTSNEKINYDELQILIEQKIEAIRSEVRENKLKEDLEELKVLYDAIPNVVNRFGYSAFKQSNIAFPCFTNIPNTVLPEESYEQFLIDCINKKKEKIKKFL